MKRKFLIFLLACALVAAAAVPGAYGAQPIDPAIGLTLTLTSANLSDPEYIADLNEIPEIEVKLYKVASVTNYGEYSSVAPFDLGNLENMNAEKWEKSAQEAAKLVAENPAGVRTPIDATLKGVDGKLSTGGISIAEPGMYLVMVAQAHGKLFSFSFEPYIVAVPGNNFYSAGEQGEDAWVYNVSAGLKPQVERLPGKLEIVKTLDEYATITGEVTFVFQIEGRFPDEEGIVYSNVAAMSFTGPGSKSVVLEGIPAGLEVTVTEVYSGGSYSSLDAVITPSKTVTIAADQMDAEDVEQTAANQVRFTNTNDDKLIPGNGVVNAFEKSDENWKWDSTDKRDTHIAVGGPANAG